MDVTVIGLGLIGGSLLQALAAAGHRVTGYDADPATRDLARDLAGDLAGRLAGDLAIAGRWTVAGSLAEAVAGAEVVALAVPLPFLPEVIAELAGHDGLITDVTSVKGPVRDLAEKHGLRRFVGGHPMAGKERSGFTAADPKLFDGCAWVLCLEQHGTDLDDWLTLATLFTGMGARVVPVTAAEHDRAVAQISHVPHLFASALARQLDGNPLAGALAAGSFRDGTRVAATRAELVVAMCGGNAVAVREVLRSLLDDLATMDEALAADPVRDLTPILAAGGELRRAWPAAGGEPIEMPAHAGELRDLGRAGGWVTAVAESRATVTAKRPETDRNSS